MSNENEKVEDLEEIFKTFFKVIREHRKEDFNKDEMSVCNITRHQAKKGIVKSIKVSVANVCNHCKGTGRKTEYEVESKECENCCGTGFVYNKQDITFEIPPRIKNNDCIVFKEKGNKFKVNDERGDLYIKIHIYGNKRNRKGRNIYE